MSSPSEKYNLHLLKEILKTPDYCSYQMIDEFRSWDCLWKGEQRIFLNGNDYVQFVEWIHLKLDSMENNDE
jgi:hypothetical protein